VIVTVVGIGLALGNWLSLLAMAILPTLAIAFRMRVEERALAEQFGERYQDFCKTRRAVLPIVW
jgi:protein-S-isoprenylcysteine O-methyltransferase Ste14